MSNDEATGITGAGRRLQVARAVSIILHPFIVIPLAIALVALRSMPPQRAIVFASIVTATTILPIIVLIIRQMRRGAWTNFDVSVRRDRPLLFVVSLVLTAALAAVEHFLGVSPGIVQGTIASSLLIALAALINVRLKLSLHCAFTAFFATSFMTLDRTAATFLLLALPILGWSRVTLRRHSLGEVVAGSVLGGIVGVALALW